MKEKNTMPLIHLICRHVAYKNTLTYSIFVFKNIVLYVRSPQKELLSKSLNTISMTGNIHMTQKRSFKRNDTQVLIM